MHQFQTVSKIGVAATLLALSVGGIGLFTSSTASAQSADPNCRSVEYYPGAVSVIGKAQGTATAGDFRVCSVNYQCAANAKRVQAVAFGVASPGSVLSAETFAIASDFSESILSSCEAVERNGRKTRVCAGEPQQFFQETSVATQAECAVAVGAPAGGKVLGTATCLCE